MIRKLILIFIAGILLVAGIGYYKFLSPKTQFSGERKFLYIRTNHATKQAVLDSLVADSMVSNINDFVWLGDRMQYWENIKPGKYLVKKGESIYSIVKKLRTGNHTPVNLVINKLRVREDLARLIGKNFEADSASVKEWLDSSDVSHFYEIIPNTYSFPWTYPVPRIMKKLNEEYDIWWAKNDRLQKADSAGFSPREIYIIASIVEEETNIPGDKLKIASVYFNRIKKKMPLQADPTIRYALKNFTMNRILYADLAVPSPYNTYRNPGLPPGPICTPSPATIDSVLNAPTTDYLFFVANADLKGGSTFTSTLQEHSRAAREYQDSLTAWLKRKAAREKATSDSIAKAKL